MQNPKAAYIVTRNIRDFKDSKVPALKPSELLETVSGKKVYGGYSAEIKVRSATKRSVGKASVKVCGIRTIWLLKIVRLRHLKISADARI